MFGFQIAKYMVTSSTRKVISVIIVQKLLLGKLKTGKKTIFYYFILVLLTLNIIQLYTIILYIIRRCSFMMCLVVPC